MLTFSQMLCSGVGIFEVISDLYVILVEHLEEHQANFCMLGACDGMTQAPFPDQ